jgi:hypothetical protein
MTLLIFLMNCKTMTIVIEDREKIDFKKAKTDIEKLKLMAESQKNLSIRYLDLLNQVLLADGYKIKVLDLREKENK